MLSRFRSRSKSKGTAGRFLEAAHAGNLEKLLEFINKKVDVNTSNEIGVAALHLAAKAGHTNIIAELLKHGANIDAATKKGLTALHVASLAGQVETLRLLLQNNSKINIQSKDGFTALYMAAQENHFEAVKLLLSYRASQSLTTSEGFTALTVALQQGHEETAKALLEHGSSAKIQLPWLHIATKKGDVRAVGLLLKQVNSDANVTSKSGFTPLHIAAHYGNADIGYTLIKNGADVNFRAKNDICPLHVASKRSRTSMIHLLLDKGAIIDCQTKDGMTPLHCATVNGGNRIIACLLDRGAPVGTKTQNGSTALHLAVQGDHVNCARLLLLHKALINDVSHEQLTPLHIAAHCGNLRSVRLLLERKCDVNPRATNGFTPLHVAVKQNHKEVVEILTKYGASVETRTETGLTPLNVASFTGHVSIVSYLLHLGADPDYATVKGETALHFATMANHLEVINKLLNNGSQVDSRSKDQLTPLHVAAHSGNAESVALLLHHGASPNAKAIDSNTPLHVAAAAGRHDVAQQLLEHGASNTATNEKGFLPIHMAAKHGSVRLARLLLAKGDVGPNIEGGSCLTPLHLAVHHNKLHVALFLLEKGASPKIQANNGYTALHVAAAENRQNLVPSLLDHGAKINATSQLGFTPLHLAAKAGHSSMASLLLERGADANFSSVDGFTPMHLAALKESASVSEILSQFGADVDPSSKSGVRPIHVAHHFGNAKMVQFLLDRGAEVGPIVQMDSQSLLSSCEQITSDTEPCMSSVCSSSQSANDYDANSLSDSSTFHSPQQICSPIDVLNTQEEDISHLFAIDLLPDLGYLQNSSFLDPCSLLRSQFVYTKDDNNSDEDHVSLLVEPSNVKMPPSRKLKSLESETEQPPSSLPVAMVTRDSNAANYHFDSPQRPLSSKFFISFLVDARGGSMHGCRQAGVRIVIPPDMACMPTRVTCRFVRKEKLPHRPPLVDGEALASRVLEMGPSRVTFSGPVIIEVSHFASLRGNQREIVILRSENGQKWREHIAPECDDSILRTLDDDYEDSSQKAHIITDDFPRYFALVSRIRQEIATIGPKGGALVSSVVPFVRATFPPSSVMRSTKVRLQAQLVSDDLLLKSCGAEVRGVSPIMTIEPRHRRFHQPINVTLPLPKSTDRTRRCDSADLRVLTSVSGGTAPAFWEDVTDTTTLTILEESATLFATVSARFWLMECSPDISTTRARTVLYRETMVVPFMSKFVVFAKRRDQTEVRIRLFCITDDRLDKTLESQENFLEVARSSNVEVLDGKPIYVDVSGNLQPQLKPFQNLHINFHAFRENRLPFVVRIDAASDDPVGRMTFTYEPKSTEDGVEKTTPICVLEIKIPEVTDGEGLDSEQNLIQYDATSETNISKAELHLTDIADTLDTDWIPLAVQLGMTPSEISAIQSDYDFLPEQALVMLHNWVLQNGEKASGNRLERALKQIGRGDVISTCMHNVVTVTDSREKTVAKGYIDDGSCVKDEIGSAKDLGLSSRESSVVGYGQSSENSFGEFGSLGESRSFCYETGSESSSVTGKRYYVKTKFDDDDDDDRSDDRCLYVDRSVSSSAYANLRSIESEESDGVLSADEGDLDTSAAESGTEDFWHSIPQVRLRKPQNEARTLHDASIRLSQVSSQESDVTWTPDDVEDMEIDDMEREVTPVVQETPMEMEKEDHGFHDFSETSASTIKKRKKEESKKTIKNKQEHPDKLQKIEDVDTRGRELFLKDTGATQKQTVTTETVGKEATANVSNEQNVPEKIEETITGFPDLKDDEVSEIMRQVDEGDIFLNTEAEEGEELLEDGTRIKHRIITTRQMRQMTESFLKGDVVLQSKTWDQLVGMEIQDDIIELAPDVIEEFGPHLQHDETAEEFQEVLPDGMLVKKVIRNVRVLPKKLDTLQQKRLVDPPPEKILPSINVSVPVAEQKTVTVMLQTQSEKQMLQLRDNQMSSSSKESCPKELDKFISSGRSKQEGSDLSKDTLTSPTKECFPKELELWSPEIQSQRLMSQSNSWNEGSELSHYKVTSTTKEFCITEPCLAEIQSDQLTSTGHSEREESEQLQDTFTSPSKDSCSKEPMSPESLMLQGEIEMELSKLTQDETTSVMKDSFNTESCSSENQTGTVSAVTDRDAIHDSSLSSVDHPLEKEEIKRDEEQTENCENLQPESQETETKLDAVIKSQEQEIIMERFEGEIIHKTEVREEEDLSESGHRVLRRVTTTRHIRPFLEAVKKGSTITMSKKQEELVGTEIDEDVTEFVTSFTEKEEETETGVTSVEESSETLPDGTWITKKVTHNVVNQKTIIASLQYTDFALPFQLTSQRLGTSKDEIVLSKTNTSLERLADQGPPNPDILLEISKHPDAPLNPDILLEIPSNPENFNETDVELHSKFRTSLQDPSNPEIRPRAQEIMFAADIPVRTDITTAEEAMFQDKRKPWDEFSKHLECGKYLEKFDIDASSAEISDGKPVEIDELIEQCYKTEHNFGRHSDVYDNTYHPDSQRNKTQPEFSESMINSKIMEILHSKKNAREPGMSPDLSADRLVTTSPLCDLSGSDHPLAEKLYEETDRNVQFHRRPWTAGLPDLKEPPEVSTKEEFFMKPFETADFSGSIAELSRAKTGKDFNEESLETSSVDGFSMEPLEFRTEKVANNERKASVEHGYNQASPEALKEDDRYQGVAEAPALEGLNDKLSKVSIRNRAPRKTYKSAKGYTSNTEVSEIVGKDDLNDMLTQDQEFQPDDYKSSRRLYEASKEPSELTGGETSGTAIEHGFAGKPFSAPIGDIFSKRRRHNDFDRESSIDSLSNDTAAGVGFNEATASQDTLPRSKRISLSRADRKSRRSSSSEPIADLSPTTAEMSMAIADLNAEVFSEKQSNAKLPQEPQLVGAGQPEALYRNEEAEKIWLFKERHSKQPEADETRKSLTEVQKQGEEALPETFQQEPDIFRTRPPKILRCQSEVASAEPSWGSQEEDNNMPPKMTRSQSLLQDTLECHARFLSAIAKIDDIAPGFLFSPALLGPDVTQETVKGKLQCSSSDTETKEKRENDRLISRKSTVIRYFQPVVQNLYRSGMLFKTRESELLLGKYVDEYVYDSPADSCGENLETTTSVEEAEETLSDGSWLKHKTTRIITHLPGEFPKHLEIRQERSLPNPISIRKMVGSGENLKRLTLQELLASVLSKQQTASSGLKKCDEKLSPDDPALSGNCIKTTDLPSSLEAIHEMDCVSSEASGQRNDDFQYPPNDANDMVQNPETPDLKKHLDIHLSDVVGVVETDSIPSSSSQTISVEYTPDSVSTQLCPVETLHFPVEITPVQAETLLAREEIPPVLEEIQPVLEEIMPIRAEIPPIQKETPDQVEIPPVLEEMPPVLKEMPLVLEVMPPVVKEMPPVREEMLPVLEVLPPVVKEMPPVLEEMLPVVEIIMPIHVEIPPVQKETPFAQVEVLHAQAETSTVHAETELAEAGSSSQLNTLPVQLETVSAETDFGLNKTPGEEKTSPLCLIGNAGEIPQKQVYVTTDLPMFQSEQILEEQENSLGTERDCIVAEVKSDISSCEGPASPVSSGESSPLSDVENKVVRTKVKKMVTKKVRKVCRSGEIVENTVVEEIPDQETSKIVSLTDSVSFPTASSTTDQTSLPTDLMFSSHQGHCVYMDTMKGKPELETQVDEREETLPDGRVIIRKITKTRQKQTITKRTIMEEPEKLLPQIETGNHAGTPDLSSQTEANSLNESGLSTKLFETTEENTSNKSLSENHSPETLKIEVHATEIETAEDRDIISNGKSKEEIAEKQSDLESPV